ncbi:MAG: Ferric transporter ATP-binding subunit [Dehalococcoidia bacterium]|nr:Ferric transporter ATP-binding subunit [Dehalococcoidia bacterium]
MRTFKVAAVLGLVIMLVLTACAAPKAPSTPTTTAPPLQPVAAPSSQPSEWDKVLAAAKKEGIVTIYTSEGVETQQAWKVGMKQYGITVETVGGQGGELELKIKTEQGAKAYTADLFAGGWTNQLSTIQAGYGQPVNVAALPSLAEKDVWGMDPTKYDPSRSGFVTNWAITPSIAIDTDLVRKGEIQSWQDLLDPKWRDRLVMTDPRTGSGPGASGMWIWMTLGEDFWKKMAAQRVTFQVRYDLPVNQVAFGEKSGVIFPAITRLTAAIKAGAPLQIVHLKEGTSYNIRGVSFIKNAPHPNAALVLLNWMFSKEGQAAVCSALESNSVRKDLTPDWLRIAELRPVAYTLVEPANNIDLEGPRKGAEFTKKIFGAQ